MSFTTREFIARAALDEATFSIWVAEGWLVPADSDDNCTYGDADLARVQLIRDLTDDLGVNAEGVDVILHLIDQMHGLRTALAQYVSARAEHRD